MATANTATPVAADKTVPADKEKTTKLDAFLAGLNDPAIRQQGLAKVDTQISDLEAKLAAQQKEGEEKLAALQATRALLTGESAAVAAPVARKPGRPKASAKPAPSKVAPASNGKRGRPAGEGRNHKGAILAAIKGAGRGGISSAALYDALVAAKHDIKRTTLSTLLSKMRGNDELVALGEARDYHYKLPAKS
jgi:hypothetical protein